MEITINKSSVTIPLLIHHSLQQNPLRVLLLGQRDEQDRQGSVHHIVQSQEERVKNRRGREHVLTLEEQLHQDEGQVLVEEVQDQHTQSRTKVMSMYQQHSLHHREVRKRIVRTPRRLSSLFPHNSQSHIRLLNHRHIIRPVSNRSGDRIPIHRLHQLHHFALLQRTQATTQHSVALNGQVPQFLRTTLQGHRQTSSID